MTRSNFFKSLATLCGIAMVKPLELFGEKKDILVGDKFERYTWLKGDVKLPDWVKSIRFVVKDNPIIYHSQGDGELVDHIEIKYRDGNHAWKMLDHPKFEKWKEYFEQSNPTS